MTLDEWTKNAGAIRMIAIDSHVERGPALVSHWTPEIHSDTSALSCGSSVTTGITGRHLQSRTEPFEAIHEIKLSKEFQCMGNTT